jgi:hypothetical protein
MIIRDISTSFLYIFLILISSLYCQAQVQMNGHEAQTKTIVDLIKFNLSLQEVQTDSVQHILTEWFNAQDASQKQTSSKDSLYYHRIQLYKQFSARLQYGLVEFQLKRLDAMLLRLIRQNRFALPDLSGEVHVQQMSQEAAEETYQLMELSTSQVRSIRQNLESCFTERVAMLKVVRDTAWVEARCFALRDSFETKSLNILSPFQQKLFLELQKGDRLNLISPTIPTSEQHY